jgi:hypothetical protein
MPLFARRIHRNDKPLYIGTTNVRALKAPMIFNFPPYGRFSRLYQDGVKPKALAPTCWRPTLPVREREKSYLEWRQDTVALINQALWPMWDATAGTWLRGDSSKMMALTLADFELFSVLENAAVFDLQPESPVCAASIPSHRAFFLDEDSPRFGERYNFYDTTLPTRPLANLIPDLQFALKNMAGSVSIQIKQLLQRPRAYQVAEMLGREHKYEYAATSMTSSMSSGHCFEGCLIAAGICEKWLSCDYSPTELQLRALGQFGVDVGDRRVFAGVHYPSDNLASWIMDLRLVNEVCPDKRVGHFLANAIVNQSYIFKLLVTSAKPPHIDGVRLVQTLANAILKR